MKVDNFVLITAARNEAKFIPITLDSVVSATFRPLRWVIVDDNSDDDTAGVVQRYAEANDFIHLVHAPPRAKRDFASKVLAHNFGCRFVRDLEYRFIGNLDADVSFREDYFQKLIRKFDSDHRLGLAGGTLYEKSGERYAVRPGNRIRCVPGAIQFFRKACYESIGGYIPLELGCEDAAAEAMARMRGWGVRSFPDIPVFHNRPLALKGARLLRHLMRGGAADCRLGYHPLYELAKATRRLVQKPYVFGSVMQLAGFCMASVRHDRHSVPQSLVRYIRSEEIRLLRRYVFRRPRDSSFIPV